MSKLSPILVPNPSKLTSTLGWPKARETWWRLLTQRKPWPCIASSVIAIIATHRDTRQLGRGGPPQTGYPEHGPTPPSLIFEKAGGDFVMPRQRRLVFGDGAAERQLASRTRRLGTTAATRRACLCTRARTRDSCTRNEQCCHTNALHVTACSESLRTPCSSSIHAVQVNPLPVGCYGTAGTAFGIFTDA